MSDNRALYIEETITGAVKGLLSGRVNELLRELQFAIPVIEFGSTSGGFVMVPSVSLSGCELTEKERIIRLEAYNVTVKFPVPETPDSELHCYAYSAVFCKAIAENPSLGGIADRATVTGKKYAPPKKPDCGQGWETVITLRITVEGMAV